MKKFILLITLAVAGFSMTSCKDDGLSLDDQWIAMATVDNPDHSDLFFFDTDGGKRMWTAVRSYSSVPKDGERILVNYTLLSNKEEGSEYDHDVRINAYRKVLRKDAA